MQPERISIETMSRAPRTPTDDLLLWGGLYLALANDELHDSEHAQLSAMLGAARLEPVLNDGPPSPAHCLERYCQSVRGLPRRPRVLEVYRLLDQLLQVVAADGEVEGGELSAFAILAEELGVNRGGCENVIRNYLAEVGSRAKLSL